MQHDQTETIEDAGRAMEELFARPSTPSKTTFSEDRFDEALEWMKSLTRSDKLTAQV